MAFVEVAQDLEPIQDESNRGTSCALEALSPAAYQNCLATPTLGGTTNKEDAQKRMERKDHMKA